MIKNLLLSLILLGLSTPLLAQSSSTKHTDAKSKGVEIITAKKLQAHLEFLASDWMEGRETGKRGGQMAGDYLASMFKYIGLEPAGDFIQTNPSRREAFLGLEASQSKSYFQHFDIIEYKKDETSTLEFKTIQKNGASKTFHFKESIDYVIELNSADEVDIEAPFIWVGYGTDKEISPKKVKGKIILRQKGIASNPDSTSGALSSFKNKTALDAGVLAILEIEAPTTDKEFKAPENRFNYLFFEGDQPMPWAYDTRYQLVEDTLDQKLPFVKVTAATAEYLKRASNHSSTNKSLNASYLHLKTKVDKKVISGRNIIGKIEGKNPNDIVVVGAHYDHLGKYNGIIWNGADDNGSGTVGILGIARAFIESGIKPERTILFILYDAEEKGLFGSRYFVSHFEDLNKISAALNYDMIGRNTDWDNDGTQVSLIYTKAYDKIRTATLQNVEDFKLNLNVTYSGVDRPVGGSDNTNYAIHDIPIYWFHTGGHEHYHRPGDHADRINWNKITDIVRLGFLNTFDFVQSTDGIGKPIESN